MLIWAAVAEPLQATSQQLMNGLMAYAGTTFKLGFVAYLLIVLVIAVWSSDDSAFQRLFKNLWLGTIIFTLISNADAFQYYVSGGFHGLTTGVTRAMAGVFGGNGTPTTADSFDVIASRGFAAGIIVIKNLPWYSFKSIVLAFTVLLYWFFLFGAVGIMFLFFLVSFVVTELVINFGPLFIAMYAFPASRFLFDGWLRATMAGVLTQIFIVGLLSLFANTLNTIFGGVGRLLTTGQGQADAGNIAGQVGVLICACIIALIFGCMTFFIYRLAQSIAGGVHFAGADAIRRNLQKLAPDPAPQGGGNNGSSSPQNGAAPVADPDRSYAFNRTVGASP